MTLHVEFDREEDGRWIAEIPTLPGCLVYAPSRSEALTKVEALALRILADRLEHGEARPEDVNVSFVVSAAAKPTNRVKLPATKASWVVAALLRIGWSVKRETGSSHRVLQRTGWPEYVFAFHDDEEIGPRMLARVAKKTGLGADDL